MTVAILAPSPIFKAFDNNGIPLANGQLFTYAGGTSIAIATYTDSTGTVQNANPITLNARGECALWLLPNISYKLVLADAFGNTIWTVDQITQNQILTLYGGVDSGSANAYVLNFTAAFTALTDGIVLYWVPSHTNTGASTLNVNSLGVVTITNQDGTPLSAGQLMQNQTAVVMYKSGAWLLLSSGNVPLSGTFTGSLIGCATTLNPVVGYWIVGKMCTLRTGATVATSSAVSMTLTGLPAPCQPATAGSTLPCSLEDNTVSILGWATVGAGSGTITFGAGAANNQSGFTASGTKGLNGGWSITYSLG